MIIALLSQFAVAATVVDMPDHVSTQLLSPSPYFKRTFVHATLSNGDLGLFLVDTGSAITILSQKTADALDLNIVQNSGTLTGLSGRASFDSAHLTSLVIAGARIEDIRVAVNVTGVPDSVRILAIDGIIGNDIWSLFTLEVDYPAHELRLHRPGAFTLPKSAQAMTFDGQQVFATGQLALPTNTGRIHDQEVALQIDTGAGDILISGSFMADSTNLMWTDGVEGLYGLGASVVIPASDFVVNTRRVAVDSLFLGGSHIALEDSNIRWVNHTTLEQKDSTVRALVGQNAFANHCLILDYDNEKLAIVKSRSKKSPPDAVTLALAYELTTFQDNPDRAPYRAALHLALSETADDPTPHLTAAVDELTAFIQRTPPSFMTWDATTILSKTHRQLGNIEKARALSATLPRQYLAKSEHLYTVIHDLINQGDAQKALDLVVSLVSHYGESSALLRSRLGVALSDTHVALGDYPKAMIALHQAIEEGQNPDSYLLRRGRLSWLSGDIDGSNAHLRRLMEAFPTEGETFWLTALVNAKTPDKSAYLLDVERAIERVQPIAAPLDFQIAALHWLAESTDTLRRQGIKRDCAPSRHAADKANCVGWYNALAGFRPTINRRRMNRLVSLNPYRPDYLDTLAVLQYASGDPQAASTTAATAASLDPGNIYMLWQSELYEKAASR